MSDVTVPAGYIPYDEIPDSGVLLDGMYHVAGEEMLNEPSSSGKKMYSARMVVVAPEEYQGMYVFENFVIGSDDDAGATQMSTWKKSIGARRFKGMLKAAGIPSSTDEAQVIAGFKGVQFMIQVSQYTERGGDYDGSIRNRIGAFYRVGERKAEVTGKPGAVKATPAVKPVAAAPAPTPAPPTLAPAAPAPPVVTPPVAPTPPAAPPQPEPPAELPCVICNQKVPIAEFQAHSAMCMAAKAAAQTA